MFEHDFHEAPLKHPMLPKRHIIRRREFLNRAAGTSVAGLLGGFTRQTNTYAAPAAHQRASSRKLALGTNLSPAVRWSPWWPDSNAALRISHWFTDDWQGVAADPSGYPRQVPAQTLLFHDIPQPALGVPSYPPGEYIITWDGTASLTVGFDARASMVEPNRIVARVSNATEEGFLLRVESGLPRNLQIAMPANAPAPREILAGYDVVRFMDWLGVNLPRTEPLTWANRPQPGRMVRAQDASGEYAVEDCVTFANDTGCDPWFCMHHTADETYIRGFAQYVADHCHADRVYVEWSNECWNVIFPQGQHYVFGGFEDWPEEIARDASRAFRIWKEVLGDRVIRVAACQLENPWVGAVLSEALQGEFDVLSPSAYFGLPNPDDDGPPLPRTAEEMLAACVQSIQSGVIRQSQEAEAQTARRWGKPLVAYEGGQHLMQPRMLEDAELAEEMIRAQLLPAMKTAYLENLRLIESLGYELFCHYTMGVRWDNYGCWGITSNQNVSSPKLAALQEFFGLQ